MSDIFLITDRVTGCCFYYKEAFMLDKKLLEILACPICKGELLYDRSADELVCGIDKLAYPGREGVPVM